MSYGKYASQLAYAAAQDPRVRANVRAAASSGARYLRQWANRTPRAQRFSASRPPSYGPGSEAGAMVSGRRGLSTGFYKGRFPRAKHAMAPSDALVNRYCANGYVVAQEVYGSTSDADCVYVGHSTYNSDAIGNAIASAVLRRLLRKIGFDPDEPSQEIPFNSYNDSSGFELRWNHISADGSITAEVYAIPNNTTLATLVTASGFGTRVTERFNKDDGFTRYDFDRIALYSLDGTTGRLAAEINLKREHIEVEVVSTLTVQNRTKPATGTATTTDAVDNQPLKGILYSCNSGVPTIATMGNSGLEQSNINGVILQQAVDLSPATYFREPPPAKLFTNCKRSVRVAMEPGDIKRTSLHWRVSGMFNTVIETKMTNIASTTGTIQVRKAPGKCEFMALEERLETGSSNLITISYECEKRYCARSWPGKMTAMLPLFSKLQMDN